jgi:hypothetical protein
VQVRGDPSSPAVLRLFAAGNAVKRAAENLVRSAQESAALSAPLNADDINMEVSDKVVRVRSEAARELTARRASRRRSKRRRLS